MARRIILVLFGAIVSLVAIAVVALLVLTGTDFGRERVRQFALERLRGATHGIVRMGEIGGNLLTGITVQNFSITDSAGRPFVSFDRATVRYNLRPLLGKRIYLDDVHLVHPVIVIERLPGSSDWNYERIFRGDTTPSTDSSPGFGSWITMTDVTIEQGRVIVRKPWEPDEDVPADARDSVLKAALGGAGRTRVERAPDGYQEVMDFRAIDGRLPLLRVADPDSGAVLINVGMLRGVAEPFREPAAVIRNLAGVFRVTGDSLWFRSARAALTGSRVSASATYAFEGDDTFWLQLHADTVALRDVRWLFPTLPAKGGGTLDLTFRTAKDTTEVIVQNAELAVEDARLAGDFGITLGDSIRFHHTDLRFSRVDTRLIERVASVVHSPRRGTLSGGASVAGSLAAMHVDADVSFDDVRSGTSRVVARGEVGVAGGFRARDLRLRLLPAQMDLARIALPTLPIGGTVSGTAILNGSATTRLAATVDLSHRDRANTSRITGEGAVTLKGRKRIDVDLRVHPLSLVTVGRFEPAIGLQGSVTGPIRARGPLSNVAVDAELRLPDGGQLLAAGTVDVESARRGYDLGASLTVFNLRSVLESAPRTSLTARAAARGRGFDPATMTAVLAADLARSEIDSLAVDSVHARLTVANGVLTIDSSSARTPFGRAEVHGSFGLVGGRDGELTYRVEIDSLAAIRRFLPEGDTGTVAPRPGRTARVLARARADSARIARATEVARAAVGGPEPGPVRVDTARGLAVDSLAGSVYAAGLLGGNLHDFDLRGRAALRDVVARGNTVRSGRTEYAWIGARTARSRIAAGVTLNHLQAAGLEIDSVDARVAYQAPGGHVEIAIQQDTALTYSARADFALHLEHREMHLQDVRLRFDSTTWTTARPGTIRWGRRGIEVDSVELLRGGGTKVVTAGNVIDQPDSLAVGRIFVNGLIPTSGAAGVEVDVRGLEIAHIVALLQSDIQASGLLTLAARLEGSRRSPSFRGAAGLTRASYRGTAIPDSRAAFEYTNAELTARAEAVSPGGAPLAVATATLPINLAFTDVSGPRLADGPLVGELRADSLPLDALPRFTDAVSNIRGRLIGAAAVRGTVRNPQIVGQFALDLGSMRIVSTGQQLRDITGVLRFNRDTLVIDSLVGSSDGGIVALRGGMGMKRFTEPAFDLEFTAENALMLDNELGRLRADAAISVEGPYESVRITGLASILQGVIYLPEPESRTVIKPNDPAVFAVIDTSLVDVGEILPGQSALLGNLRIDVEVRVSRDTWVRSRDGNFEVYTPSEAGPLLVSVDRRRDAITLQGVVATDRGEYSVAGRRFEIRRGSVTFIGTGEINPLLQITVAYEVQIPGREALTITVTIGGTARNPRLTLQSTAQPPISQTDLLSYLAFGRSSTSLLQQQGSSLSGQATGSGGLVGSVAGFATRQLTSIAIGAALHDVVADLTSRLTLDVLDVRPADIPLEASLGAFGSLLRGTEIEAGKYLNRRTFLGFQFRPSTEATPGVRLEHRMPKGLRLEASFEPRFLLQQPSLSSASEVAPTGVFGAFLIREWRF